MRVGCDLINKVQSSIVRDVHHSEHSHVPRSLLLRIAAVAAGDRLGPDVGPWRPLTPAMCSVKLKGAGGRMGDEREWHLERIRGAFGADGLTERKMFGGNAFMLHGNMAVGLMGGGELMVRVGRDAYDAALESEHVREMDFTGRPMRGYVYVDSPGWQDDASLAAWVQRGKDFVSTLPRK